MRSWVVAGAVIEGPDGILLVQNRRRDGTLDWTTPGGVIEVDDGETVRDGLAREVREETGLEVTAWDGPLYEVACEAPGMGWRLRVEVHRAVTWAGDVRIDDPDAIVVDARYVAVDECANRLASNSLWVHEPLAAWLADRASCPRTFRYRVDGDRRETMAVTRL